MAILFGHRTKHIWVWGQRLVNKPGSKTEVLNLVLDLGSKIGILNNQSSKKSTHVFFRNKETSGKAGANELLSSPWMIC